MIFVVEWHENEFGGESSRSHVEAESEQAAKEIFVEHHPEYEIECIYKYVEPELLRKTDSHIKILELIHMHYACPSQWHAFTSSSQIRIEYKCGDLCVFENCKVLFYKKIGNENDGFMNTKSLINILSDNGFDFSECKGAAT